MISFTSISDHNQVIQSSSISEIDSYLYSLSRSEFVDYINTQDFWLSLNKNDKSLSWAELGDWLYKYLADFKTQDLYIRIKPFLVRFEEKFYTPSYSRFYIFLDKIIENFDKDQLFEILKELKSELIRNLTAIKLCKLAESDSDVRVQLVEFLAGTIGLYYTKEYYQSFYEKILFKIIYLDAKLIPDYQEVIDSFGPNSDISYSYFCWLLDNDRDQELIDYYFVKEYFYDYEDQRFEKDFQLKLSQLKEYFTVTTNEDYYRGKFIKILLHKFQLGSGFCDQLREEFLTDIKFPRLTEDVIRYILKKSFDTKNFKVIQYTLDNGTEKLLNSSSRDIVKIICSKEYREWKTTQENI